jgi:hypothetical protein
MVNPAARPPDKKGRHFFDGSQEQNSGKRGQKKPLAMQNSSFSANFVLKE